MHQAAIPHQPLYDKTTGLILMVGWIAYIILSPLYFFESGLPQIADYIILAVSGLAILIYFLKKKIIFNRVYAFLAFMVVLFFCINITNYIFYRDDLFLYASVYYLFNAFAFLATVILFKYAPSQMRHYAAVAIFISLVMQVLWITFMDSNSPFRETGSFNNPNQLGYWALLSSCYILILRYGEKMRWFDLIAFLICAYICSIALSRAVIVSFALIFLAFFMARYVSLTVKIGISLCVTLYSFFQIAIFDNPAFIIENLGALTRVIERVQTIQTESGVLSERGYQRILDNPQYLIYGAGEGYYARFREGNRVALELHSGLGTILFSYGVLGFVLFSGFILSIFQRAPILFWILLAAIMAYGITHQHVRFTGFWIFLGLTYAMTRYVIPRQAKGSSHPPLQHHLPSAPKTSADQTI
jgi:hypothetical protein